MNIISVKFITDGKIMDYDDEEQCKVSDLVIVNTSQLYELGKIVDRYEWKEGMDYKNQKDKGNIVRKVNCDDQKKINENKKNALKLIPLCKEKVKKYKLIMDIMDADLSFDEKKLTIYFSSEKRIDFRLLVSDFVRTFKKLVRLQQIGQREQIRRMGWVGKCGQEVCCARFSGCSEQVTLDCAKRQNLSEVNCSKINGVCGKLMCCLKYEDHAYEEIKKTMPEIGDKIKTKQGVGKVIKQKILSKSVIVLLENKDRIEVEV